ncbi:hypothetical protein M0657_004439 [Pyricularia oryzae]|nr:hypothetical protein M9X92_005895 [Pyricularia oryzae]KAI7924816.1 hypothetical protein M0657_004439 [Pyricularia oryzae]
MAEHQCDLLQSWAPLPARQHKTSKPGPTYATLGIHVVGLYRVALKQCCDAGIALKDELVLRGAVALLLLSCGPGRSSGQPLQGLYHGSTYGTHYVKIAPITPYLRPRESIITIGSMLGDCMGLGSTWPNSESVVLFAVERLKENPAKPGRKGKQNVDHAEELLT